MGLFGTNRDAPQRDIEAEVERKTRKVRRFHTDRGPSVEGLHVDTTRDHYIVERAKYLVGEDQTEQVGLVEIPRERVVFIQVLA